MKRKNKLITAAAILMSIASPFQARATCLSIYYSCRPGSQNYEWCAASEAAAKDQCGKQEREFSDLNDKIDALNDKLDELQRKMKEQK